MFSELSLLSLCKTTTEKNNTKGIVHNHLSEISKTVMKVFPLKLLLAKVFDLNICSFKLSYLFKDKSIQIR